jgi:hypothetical protein
VQKLKTLKHHALHFMLYYARTTHTSWVSSMLQLIKDEVLLTVGCPIFPPFYIDSQIFVHRKLKKIDQLIFRNVFEGRSPKISIIRWSVHVISFILNAFCSRFVIAVTFILSTPLFRRETMHVTLYRTKLIYGTKESVKILMIVKCFYFTYYKVSMGQLWEYMYMEAGKFLARENGQCQAG